MTREQIAASFGAVLARRYGTEWGCLWDAKIQRYVVTGRSAVGRPTREVFGWFHDPTRSGWNAETLRFEHPPVPVDPDTGLPPFRELDAQAQREIIEAMERTYVASPAGAGTWAGAVRARREHNDQLYRTRVRQKAEDVATILSEVDLRRPWVKFHRGPARARRVARHA